MTNAWAGIPALHSWVVWPQESHFTPLNLRVLIRRNGHSEYTERIAVKLNTAIMEKPIVSLLFYPFLAGLKANHSSLSTLQTHSPESSWKKPKILNFWVCTPKSWSANKPITCLRPSIKYHCPTTACWHWNKTHNLVHSAAARKIKAQSPSPEHSEKQAVL